LPLWNVKGILSREEEAQCRKFVEVNKHLNRRNPVFLMVVALVFSGATGCVEMLSHRDIKPPCESPAPIEGRFDSRAPGFLIHLQPAADAKSIAHDLASRYGFQLGTVVSGGTVITAGPMTPQTVAALRCDSAVKAITHNFILEHVT